MFLENTINSKNTAGWIEVITGSMFSGKTEELIRRLKRVGISGQKMLIFKPDVDTRYHKVAVVSHDENQIRSIPVTRATELFSKIKSESVVGIDEAQFFGDELVEVCSTLANQGIRVIVAGLDMDFQGKPFGSMPALMAIAEYITKVHAICVKCGNLANNSHRLHTDKTQVLLGETEKYEALCRSCFNNSLAK